MFSALIFTVVLLFQLCLSLTLWARLVALFCFCVQMRDFCAEIVDVALNTQVLRRNRRISAQTSNDFINLYRRKLKLAHNCFLCLKNENPYMGLLSEDKSHCKGITKRVHRCFVYTLPPHTLAHHPPPTPCPCTALCTSHSCISLSFYLTSAPCQRGDGHDYLIIYIFHTMFQVRKGVLLAE